MLQIANDVTLAKRGVYRAIWGRGGGGPVGSGIAHLLDHMHVSR